MKELKVHTSKAFMFTSLRANCDANRSIAEETERSYKTSKISYHVEWKKWEKGSLVASYYFRCAKTDFLT